MARVRLQKPKLKYTNSFFFNNITNFIPPASATVENYKYDMHSVTTENIGNKLVGSSEEYFTFLRY